MVLNEAKEQERKVLRKEILQGLPANLGNSSVSNLHRQLSPIKKKKNHNTDFCYRRLLTLRIRVRDKFK